jgi:hypothetical protein
LCKSDQLALEALKSNQDVVASIQRFVGQFQSDEKTLLQLSESVAYLPIEDLVL